MAFRFLQSEPEPALSDRLGHLNAHVHSTVADLLQVILSRSDLELPVLKHIETALLSRLLLCVHRGSVDLQNKLLHVLHSAISAVSSLQKKTSRKGQADTASQKTNGDRRSTEQEHNNSLLTRVLVDGISTQRSSAVIHHWIDFLLMTIPTFRQSLHFVIDPLVDCLASKLFAFIDEIRITYDPYRKGKAVATASDATDADYVVLMNAYERLLLAAIDSNRTNDEGEETQSAEKSAGGESNTGFLGYVTNVLGTSDSHTPSAENLPRVRCSSFGCL
jgi:hypothetical protein